MSSIQRTRRMESSLPALRLYNPPLPPARSARWRINGHPASLLIWSAEEWERLEERPSDAQFHPFGVWCALRLE